MKSSANYGEHKEKNLIKGNVNIQRYLLGLDTTRDAVATSFAVRRSTRMARFHSLDRHPAQRWRSDPRHLYSRLRSDIAACVPINPFGEGSVTDAARNYVLVDSLATGKITQFNVGLGFRRW
jgi:hypothetical protein